MKKRWDIGLPRVLAMPIVCLLFFLCFFRGSSQECPSLISPLNGATSVSTNATIRWEPIVGVPGYILSLGTTPGGTDILDERNVGSSTTYISPTGLPENTQIFVTITLFFFNQPNITCDSQNFTTAPLAGPPACTSLSNPLNNSTAINAATTISWNFAPNATGYFLTLGTTLNGSEILNSLDVGNTQNYNPPTDLPAESDIYVTVVPYNRIGSPAACPTFRFSTAPVASLPACTSLITPFNGETNVPLSPTLEWNSVPDAIGYRVSIGTSPFDTDILEDAFFTNPATRVLNFEPNRTFFITIIPFNTAGEAIGCSQETFSTILGCGPYFDAISGELIVLNPEITFPDTIGICRDRDTTLISASGTADGYRWYAIGPNDSEVLISSNIDVLISEPGTYILEAYNTIAGMDGNFECVSSKIFEVEESEIARINNIRVTQQGDGIDIIIEAEGIGNYEYALDNEDGPYQNTNRFTGIAPGNHTVFVRDKNGCGIVKETIQQDLTVDGFPNFFTPNGDGVNDFWQYLLPAEMTGNPIVNIWIFDRYSNLLAQIDPQSQGWDGRLNGNALPESTYWFKAISIEEREIKGHFFLKR